VKQKRFSGVLYELHQHQGFEVQEVHTHHRKDCAMRLRQDRRRISAYSIVRCALRYRKRLVSGLLLTLFAMLVA
jgi:hypothetical protein